MIDPALLGEQALPDDRERLTVELHRHGPALWPEHIDARMLAGLHRGMGTPIFSTMYQAREGGLAGQIIRPEFLRYYELLPSRSVCYMTVDPAISTKTQADETACVVGNVDAEGNLYIRWVWHGRVGIAGEAAVLKAAWDYYRPVAIGIEDVAFQAAVIQYIAEKHPELPVQSVTPGGKDKLTRHLGLGALYEFGRVYHHPSLRSSAFEWQLTHLPNGRHDDMADAAQYLTVLAGMGGGAVALDRRPAGFH